MKTTIKYFTHTNIHRACQLFDSNDSLNNEYFSVTFDILMYENF